MRLKRFDFGIQFDSFLGITTALDIVFELQNISLRLAYCCLNTSNLALQWLVFRNVVYYDLLGVQQGIE